MTNNYRAVRGMRDLLDEELKIHYYIIEKAKQLTKNYGYSELITPILEYSEIFNTTLGTSSDIVNKEQYTFLDRDKHQLTLRPEFTASVARAYITNGLTQKSHQKFFSYGPLFRHDRPQKGRYRQFHQINCEFIGAYSPYSDAETIILAYSILKSLGIAHLVELEINTLGDQESRQMYRDALVDYFHNYKSSLSDESQARLERNPLRILDSKDVNDALIIANAPNIINYLNNTSRQYYDKVLLLLEDNNIKYNLNKLLVRGLDYYTHTIFEFTAQIDSKLTVLAGGRYDHLISLMGGPETPAIGFAAGIERLAELMKTLNLEKMLNKVEAKIAIIPIGAAAEILAFKLANELREVGLDIVLEFDLSLKKRFQRANSLGVKKAIIIGEEEISNQVCKIKDMENSQEEVVSINELKNQLIRSF